MFLHLSLAYLEEIGDPQNGQSAAGQKKAIICGAKQTIVPRYTCTRLCSRHFGPVAHAAAFELCWLCNIKVSSAASVAGWFVSVYIKLYSNNSLANASRDCVWFRSDW